MNLIKIIFIIVAIIYVCLLIIFSFLTKKPFKTLLYNGALGLFSFFVIDITAFFTGVWIPINDYTVVISMLGGIPGVVLLVIARFLVFSV